VTEPPTLPRWEALGKAVYSERTLALLEAALQWKPGTAQAILAGTGTKDQHLQPGVTAHVSNAWLIGQTLRAARLARGWSVEAAVERAGVSPDGKRMSPTTWIRAERGDGLRAGSWRYIATAFDITLDLLLTALHTTEGPRLVATALGVSGQRVTHPGGTVDTPTTDALSPPHPSFSCAYCGQLIGGTWLCRQEPNGYWTYYHSDLGPYGPRTYPTCAMVIAEADALGARGWSPPQGCVTWPDSARKAEAAALTKPQ
jgi:transcriptional regulator with XRE-family HTH domain